jgi:uncharacterized protein YndB with AHSA1/START domain
MEPLVQISESIDIEAPVGRVWRLVTDVARHPAFAGPKSITKAIDFTGPLEVGQRWIAHERFGPQRFDAPSDITEVDSERRFAWVSFPPGKESNRGDGGRVFWAYELTPAPLGCRLTHTMQVLPPQRGAWPMKAMYAVMRLPDKQRAGVLTTLRNIKAAAEDARPAETAD